MNDDGRLFVAAVTQDVSARADLAKQLPGESVLLLFPDRTTAAKTLGEGELGAGPTWDPPPSETIICGGLLIDLMRIEVTWNGIPLRLTRLERAMLARLAEPPLRAWSYEHLYTAAWGDTWPPPLFGPSTDSSVETEVDGQSLSRGDGHCPPRVLGEEPGGGRGAYQVGAWADGELVAVTNPRKSWFGPTLTAVLLIGPAAKTATGAAAATAAAAMISVRVNMPAMVCRPGPEMAS